MHTCIASHDVVHTGCKLRLEKSLGDVGESDGTCHFLAVELVCAWSSTAKFILIEVVSANKDSSLLTEWTLLILYNLFEQSFHKYF